MAEEVDIRHIWQRSKQKNLPSVVNFNQFDAKSDSGRILKNVRLVLRIEYWLNIIFIVPICYWFRTADYHWGWTAGYIAVTIIYLFYYQFLIKKTRNIDFSGDVKNSLRRVANYLWFFLLHYQIIIWVSLITGYTIGLIDGLSESDAPIENPVKFWAVMIGASILLIGLIGGFFHFLIHMIYGRKIRRLRKIVKAFD